MKYSIYVNDRDQKKESNDHLTWSRDLPGLILATTVARIVNGMDEPYILNPGVGGKKGYLLRTMVIVCIMLDAERKMVDMCHDDYDLPVFKARYHRRSVIEAVFGAIKKKKKMKMMMMMMCGSYVRCHRPDN